MPPKRTERNKVVDDDDEDEGETAVKRSRSSSSVEDRQGEVVSRPGRGGGVGGMTTRGPTLDESQRPDFCCAETMHVS